MLSRRSRLGRRTAADIAFIRQAGARIEELSAVLDRLVADEQRPEQRLQHLRHTTGQITRVANDGIQAYRRVSSVLRDERERADADAVEIERTSAELAEVRGSMIAALEAVSHRYPWAQPWSAEAPG